MQIELPPNLNRLLSRSSRLGATKIGKRSLSKHFVGSARSGKARLRESGKDSTMLLRAGLSLWARPSPTSEKNSEFPKPNDVHRSRHSKGEG